MALRTSLRAWRRRLVILAAVLTIGGLVALHHMDVHPMDESGMHPMTTVVGLCMAVLPLAAVALALRRSSLPRTKRWSPLKLARPSDFARLWRPLPPRARAGPLFLSVMRH